MSLIDIFPNLTRLEPLLHSPLFALALSLLAFHLGQKLYLACSRAAVFHPTISGAAGVGASLYLLDIDYQAYADGSYMLLFMLGPATVGLAVPMYRYFHLIRSAFIPLALTTLLGASFAVLAATGIAHALGADWQTVVSIAPKSVTTPIALGLADEAGGIAVVAAGAVILTGIVCISIAPALFRWLGIKDDRIWGFCMGLTAHGIGTSKAFERSQTAGAFSSLALCLVGSVSAIGIPIALRYF